MTMAAQPATLCPTTSFGRSLPRRNRLAAMGFRSARGVAACGATRAPLFGGCHRCGVFPKLVAFCESD